MNAPAEARLRGWWRRILEYAATRAAVKWLALLAFVEAIFFPLPVECMLAPMGLAQPRRAFWFAAVATAGSVAGGAIGWLLGAFLFDLWEASGLSQVGREQAAAMFAEWGAWIVFAGGFTPIPFKVVAVASGVSGLNPGVFVVFALLSRGARFFLEAALLFRFGDAARVFIERRLGWVSAAAVAAAFVIFILFLR
ncbi:MAG: VTT domain-containing protein [Alphaproteobacteria bacterium]|nr:VTT domain-containing protein [Alphaproteobacteria bacterium]